MGWMTHTFLAKWRPSRSRKLRNEPRAQIRVRAGRRPCRAKIRNEPKPAFGHLQSLDAVRARHAHLADSFPNSFHRIGIAVLPLIPSPKENGPDDTPLSCQRRAARENYETNPRPLMSMRETGRYDDGMRLAPFFLATFAIAGEYTTYIGDAYPRAVAAIATDGAGNTYVTGNRGLPILPTAIEYISGVSVSGTLSSILLGLTTVPTAPGDVFVSKIDPNGDVLFTDTFAGKGVDQGLAVAVDPTGNIYVAGTTTSIDFPLSNALQSQPSQYGTGFIVKLSPDGKTILYSTYFGGLQGMTSINAMTTDAAGNLYLTGTTSSADFPQTPGLPSASAAITELSPDLSAAFVACIDAGGDKILFSGAVAGTNIMSSGCERNCPYSTTGISIALDASKNVYFGGNTDTNNLPTTSGAFLKQGLGAFAGKIAAGGTGLAYLTYLGSASELANAPWMTGANTLSSLTVDAAGNAYLAGTTGDPKFPVTTGAYQTTFAGNPVNQFGNPANTDGFVAKLKPDGSALLWATYLGGSGNDIVNSIAVDAAGDVWATGTTASANFPNTQGWSQGGDFLVEFNPTGSALAYSARYPSGTVSQTVALNTTLLVHTAGITGILSTIASTAPPTPKIFGIGNAAGGPLAGRVSPAEVISIYGPHIGTSAGFAGRVSTYPTSLAGVQVMIGGIPAPLLYLSDGQINAVVPMEVTPQAAATVQIMNGSAITAAYPVWIDSSDLSLSGRAEPERVTQLRNEPSKARLRGIVLRNRMAARFRSASRWPGGHASDQCMPFDGLFREPGYLAIRRRRSRNRGGCDTVQSAIERSSIR